MKRVSERYMSHPLDYYILTEGIKSFFWTLTIEIKYTKNIGNICGGIMRVSYDRETDIMLVEASKGKIDFAEEIENIIIHFTKDKKPVLLEIMNASEFISSISKISMRAEKEDFVPIKI